MDHGFQAVWSFGGGQPAPPPRQSYREVTTRRGIPRRGRLVQEDGDSLVVDFYATGVERVNRADVSITWRHP